MRVLFLAVAVIAAALALMPRSPGVSRAHFDRLKGGMQQAHIEAKLLGPPRNVLRQDAIIWVPQPDGKQISGTVTPGPVTTNFFPNTSGDGHQAVWLTETGVVVAYFGEDGRLEDKYFSTVHVLGPPPMLDWLVSRASLREASSR